VKVTEPEDLFGVRSLVQSVRICARYAISRIARQRTNSRQISAVDESRFGTVNHPRCKTYADLTYDEKRSLAFSAFQLAVKEIKLSENNVRVARLILEDELTPNEAAKWLGVPSSAIHQQLTRVTSALAVLKDAVEIEPQP